MKRNIGTVITIEKPIQEKCGIVGVFTPRFSKNVPLALVAASGVQHRGPQGAGMAMQTRNGIRKYVGDGLLKHVFTHERVEKLNLPARWIIVHCRYGTFGGYLKHNLQPCHIKTSAGQTVVVVHNGEFTATDKLQKKVSGKLPQGASDTYMFTQLLGQIKGKTWDEKITQAVDAVQGAFSLMIGIKDSLYVIRDALGIRPLILGQLNEGGWMIASETHAFSKVHVKVKREVYPGEIIKIDTKGLHLIRQGTQGKGNFCDFEWAYFSRPDSLFPAYHTQNDGGDPTKWMSVAAFRERCGQILAKEHPLPYASFVVGVPDSGINVAIGYANITKIPYRQTMIRDHFDSNGEQRLFLRDDDMAKIKAKVLGKISFIPDRAIWKDAIVVIGGDSIVRGNVSEKITEAAFALGAREVHWIVGFPPVMHPCHLGVSMRTGAELIAQVRGGDPIKIAETIGATSVNYISPKGFIQAKVGEKILHPRDERELFLVNGGCGGCLTGIYPVDREGVLYASHEAH